MKYTCVGISKSPRLSSLSGPADAGYPARWSCDHRVFFRLRLSSSLWLRAANWYEDIRERVNWSFIDPGHKRKIVAPDASRWQSHVVGWQLAGALAGLLLSAMSGKLDGLFTRRLEAEHSRSRSPVTTAASIMTRHAEGRFRHVIHRSQVRDAEKRQGTWISSDGTIAHG